MYVYVLETISTPKKYYIGRTSNLKTRLSQHNKGQSLYTAKHLPWRFKNAFWFNDPERAHKFERYLKSPSGRAFAKKHF